LCPAAVLRVRPATGGPAGLRTCLCHQPFEGDRRRANRSLIAFSPRMNTVRCSMQGGAMTRRSVRARAANTWITQKREVSSTPLTAGVGAGGRGGGIGGQSRAEGQSKSLVYAPGLPGNKRRYRGSLSLARHDGRSCVRRAPCPPVDRALARGLGLLRPCLAGPLAQVEGMGSGRRRLVAVLPHGWAILNSLEYARPWCPPAAAESAGDASGDRASAREAAGSGSAPFHRVPLQNLL